MNAGFSNVYDDKERADAYARLEFPGTYYLAYRDLPAIIGKHVRGTKALDFGCGAGRSTRFLLALGFDPVLGVDIAEHMVAQARERDPQGEYRLVPDGDLSGVASGTYDLVLSVFTFDNIPTMEKKVTLFQSLKCLLKTGGRIVSLVSSPEIYVHEWASFSTKLAFRRFHAHLVAVEKICARCRAFRRTPCVRGPEWKTQFSMAATRTAASFLAKEDPRRLGLRRCAQTSSHVIMAMQRAA